jgi:hypothetical protein
MTARSFRDRGGLNSGNPWALWLGPVASHERQVVEAQNIGFLAVEGASGLLRVTDSAGLLGCPTRDISRSRTGLDNLYRLEAGLGGGGEGAPTFVFVGGFS